MPNQEIVVKSRCAPCSNFIPLTERKTRMEPNREFETLEDLLEYLIARGETFAVQKIWQMIESREFDPDNQSSTLSLRKIAMKPSRELDALVAEKVMGWNGVLPQFGCDALGKAIPHYSTDIAAAWEVVEKLAEMGWRLELQAMLLYQKEIRSYTVTFDRLIDNDLKMVGVYEIKTVPFAICMAALKAVGVEVEDD